MNELKLSVILGPSFESVERELCEKSGIELSMQLQKVIIPVQKLSGDPNEFSFMAFPVPRPTTDELKNIEIIAENTYSINSCNFYMKMDTDHFGIINWIHIRGEPKYFIAINSALQEAIAENKYGKFWDFR